MLKAVIFDMDGVIVDTEPLYIQHRIDYLKKLGHKIDPQHFEKFVGTTNRKFWQETIKLLNLPHDLEELVKDSRQQYLNFLKSLPNLQPNPGIRKLIERLSKAKIKLALASSAGKKRIETLLAIFKLNNCFEVVICGDDIKNSKPAPDIYLLAAKLLKVNPEDCIAIEDATNGVKSAKMAGMKVVAYTGAPHNTQDLSAADLKIKSFDQLTLSSLETL